MKRILLPLFILVITLSQHSLDAANLYAFLVCDTHASEIEESVEEDYKNMKKEVRRICRYTGLRPRIRRYTSYRVDDGIIDAINRLKVDEDDVVIFYYSGHGMRFDSQDDPWPVLDFEYGNRQTTQWEITQELISKGPRLILSIADCCNNFITKSLITKGSSRDRRDNYRRLFLDSSGTYIASGASPGEYSFGLNDNWWSAGIRKGGFFTNALLETIRQETNQENTSLTWDAIFELAILKTHEYQLRDEQDPTIYQTPQYSYIPN